MGKVRSRSDGGRGKPDGDVRAGNKGRHARWNDRAGTSLDVAGITRIKQRDPAENEKNNIVQKAAKHIRSFCSFEYVVVVR